MLRIIAGIWRGRKLQAPAGETTRPTADRTRETLFSMLTSRLGSFDELTVADLFAGSGALGLEALSRGAAKAVFVEQDAPAIRALRANIAALHAQAQCDVRAASVLALGPAPAPLDAVMLDPPMARAQAPSRSTGSSASAGSARAPGSASKPMRMNPQAYARWKSMRSARSARRASR
jgi:16S rRNA (guanine(966)-N(2))-methyltransferase RsmD